MYLDIERQHMKTTEVKMYMVKQPYDQMATENLMQNPNEVDQSNVSCLII